MRLPIVGLLVTTAAVFVAGCEPTCQGTCRRFYDEDQCAGPTGGLERDAQIDACIVECSTALKTPGEAPLPTDGRFNPDIPAQPIKPALTNEQEAAAWMDCVWSFEDLETCRDGIDRGACAIVP
ncbi:MAG: hypothetical protein H6733_01750 [Alphaproteobacteria bacterium]|nr:hypothetical protein [Alphaproteobacteria bacterium]